MGDTLIVRTRGGQQVEMRSSFALTDMVRYGYGGLRNLKTRVGESEARGIPALHRAARVRSEAVAQLPLCCWKGEGPTRERLDSVWQAKLFRNGPQAGATNPVQTRFGFWETVEESLSWRNNAYIWCNVDPDTGRVVEWYALHPDQVTPRYGKHGGVVYRVQVAPGYIDPVGKGNGTYDVDAGTLIHLRGHGQGGQLQAPTPIEVFRDKLAGPIGRQRHEARMWRRGTALQVAIEFPPGVGKEQANQWREVWRSNYEGTEGETTAVIGGGGQIKPIGMTATDSEFVAMAHLTIEDAALIMAMPVDMMGVQIQPRPQDGEQVRRQWLQDGLGPELGRIEDTLYAYPPLFGGSQTYPAFDTSNFVRGDLATESTIVQGDVQAGILTPNEARQIKGYGPDTDPNSDKLQVTPVGGKPNPNQTPSSVQDDEDPDRASAAAVEIRMLREQLEQERRRPEVRVTETPAPQVIVEHFSADERFIEALESRDRPTVNFSPNINVQPAPVDVRVPEQLPPVVNVTVDVPEQPAPVVNVEVPVTVQPADVTVIPADDDDGPKKISVVRGANGLITGMKIEEGS